MAEQGDGKDWAMIIRISKNKQEALELLFHGSYSVLSKGGWLADCARMDLPWMIEQVREQHRKHDLPFSAVVFDAHQPHGEINWTELRQLVMSWLPEAPTVIVAVRQVGDYSSYRQVMVVLFDRRKNEFDNTGQLVPEGHLSTYLRSLLSN